MNILTDEEITNLKHNGKRYMSSQEFARAIEAAVLEKVGKVEKLEQALDVALDALIWTTGSGDFGEGGIAHEGALKCLYPAINMLKELKK